MKYIKYIILICSLMIIFTLNVSAKEQKIVIKGVDTAYSNLLTSNSFKTISNKIQMLGNPSGVTCTDILGGILPDLQSILKIIRIVGPLLVIVLSIFEYLSAIAAKNDDALKKCNSRLIKRLILVALLFFL